MTKTRGLTAKIIETWYNVRNMPSCYKCSKEEVSEEYARCPSCEAEHKKLCAQLDARPKVHEKKVKEELFAFKEVKQGIEVTTWVDRETARINGIKLPN